MQDADTRPVLTFDVGAVLTGEDFRPNVVVDDGVAGHWYEAQSINSPSANVLDFGMAERGYRESEGVRLTVTPLAGIAATDGTPWGGVDALALPFGQSAKKTAKPPRRKRAG